MTYTALKHIVFVPGPTWSHLRSGLKTSLRMVEKFQDIFISVFVYHTEITKAIKYLSAEPSSYARRIRVVTVTATTDDTTPPEDNGNMIELLLYMEQSFQSWITNELQQPTIVQVEGKPVNMLSLVIEDVLCMSLTDVHGLPVVGWWCSTATSLMSFFEHKELSPKSGIYDKLALLSDQAGDNLLKKANEVYLQDISDRLVRIPGLPAFHEWEFNTQYLPFIPPFMAFIVPRVGKILNHIDKIIFTTTFDMEPISATSISSAFKNPVTPFCIGPAVDLVSTHHPDPESPVTQFLNQAYAEKGAHSVIYGAFGTTFFPLPESVSQLMAVLDEIPKAGFRFIFALSSPHAQIDKSWMDNHVRAGNAIFPDWTNQTAVLEHPAIHYFLSHGGWNSSTETLVRGVPMILWPFIGDQPLNSLQITGIHNCGFELLQVRTGPARSKAYQNGAEVEIVGTDDAAREEMRSILALTKGPRGEHQRMNARLLGKVIADSLAPGGSGDAGLGKLGMALGLA